MNINTLKNMNILISTLVIITGSALVKIACNIIDYSRPCAIAILRFFWEETGSKIIR